MGDAEVPGSEKRRAKRIIHHYVLRARQTNPPMPADDWEISTVRNISEVGVMFYSSRRYEVGSELEIRIKDPLLQEREVKCWGTVVRCVNAPDLKDVYEAAVNFTRIDEETKDALYKSIEFFIHKEARDKEAAL